MKNTLIGFQAIDKWYRRWVCLFLSFSATQHFDESERGTSVLPRVAVRFLIVRCLDSLNLNNIFMNEWTRHKSLREYRGIGPCTRGHVETRTQHARYAREILAE